MTAPDAQPPAMWWCPSDPERLSTYDADIEVVFLDLNVALPADAVRLVADDLATGYCPDCGFEGPHTALRVRPDMQECGSPGCGASWVRSDADPAVTWALDHWQDAYRDADIARAAALAGTTTPTANVLPPLTRLLMIAEELDSGAQISPEQMADMADVLCEVHAALASTTTTEETDGDH